MIYLDNAATTMVSIPVKNAVVSYLQLFYGNPGSVHSVGRHAAEAVEDARSVCAKSINANKDDIIFTSGGSEANTLAIIGVADHLREIGKTHIITTAVEHPSVLKAMEYLESNGFSITRVSPEKMSGDIPVKSVMDAITDNTGLVSVMMVNNETGNKYDIKSMGKLCRDNCILMHTDCVQAFGGDRIDVEELNIDFMSVSGHKFHAPKGIGFLYVRNKDFLRPVIFGGGQEYGLRGGTENVPGIVGIREAILDLNSDDHRNKERNSVKRELFLKYLNCDYEINGDPYENSKTLNVRFNGVDGETLLLLLNNKGVAVSAGSACSAHSAKPSHVLKAIGLTDDEARSSIRISFSKYTTHEDLVTAARKITESVNLLRGEN